MQQRRGTASQWTSSNPILNAGEMGWESDTNKFKIGDGTNHWADLDYFIDANSTVNPSFGTSIVFEGATADSYETTLQATDPSADRTITLPDASGTVALTSDIAELSQDAIDAALTAGTGITKTYNDNANTLTLAVDTTTIQARVADVSDTEIGYLNGVTSAIQTQLDAKFATANASTTNISEGTNLYFTDERAQDAVGNSLGSGLSYNDSTGAVSVDTATIQARVADVSDTEIGYLNGVTSAIQTQLDAKAPTANASFTGTFSAPSGTITSTMIADGTIVDGDINASAAIALSKLATDPLARANHTGTQTASTISDFDTQVRTSKVTDLAAPTSSFSMNSQKITSLATPTADADAATKSYVDAATAGLNVHASVQAATTANITLASDVENGDTLDGVTLATGNRILVKNQTDKTENGIYVVAASGAPSRADDYNTAGEVDAGDFFFVEAGTGNGKTGWIQTNVIATVGSDNIEFTQFSGAGTYTAGTGLTLTGTVFSINTSTTVDTSTSQTLTNKTLTSPIISSISNTGTLTLPTSTDTLVGRATTDTLTNKSIALSSNTVSGTLADFNTAVTDADLASLAGSETLTNKTINGSNNTITNVSLTSGVTGTLPVANGGTGITSLGTGIATFLGTPSSQNLASAVTDETGSGSLVFGTGPTLSSAVATTALTLNATAELRLADTDSSHYVGFKAPGTVSTNRIWTLPSADGTSGQTLSTNGSGTLSWSTPAAGAAFSELMLIGA